MKNPITQEPVLTAALVGLAGFYLKAHGFTLDPSATEGLTAVVTLLLALLARSQVSPT